MNYIEQEIVYQKMRKHRVQEDNTEMFIPKNEYGYFTNIEHPMVMKEYEAYRQRNGILHGDALSENERHEFDCETKERHKAEWEIYISNLSQKAG